MLLCRILSSFLPPLSFHPLPFFSPPPCPLLSYLSTLLTMHNFIQYSMPCRYQQSGVQSVYPGGPPMPQAHALDRGALQTRPVELSSYGDGLLWGASLLLHLLNQTAWFKLTDLSSLVVQRQQLEYRGTGNCCPCGHRQGCVGLTPRQKGVSHHTCGESCWLVTACNLLHLPASQLHVQN